MSCTVALMATTLLQEYVGICRKKVNTFKDFSGFYFHTNNLLVFESSIVYTIDFIRLFNILIHITIIIKFLLYFILLI